MKWKKKYEISVPLIDSQHEQLFTYAEDLHNAMKKGVAPSTIRDVLTKLQRYAITHFTMEEKKMADVEYPGLAIQQQAHKHFNDLFLEIANDFEENGLSPALVDTINNELTNWIKSHVTGLDKEFGYYNKQYQKNI
jgi:hemerythrin